MMDSLLQQFAGGGAQNMEGSQLVGGVSQMLGGASSEHSSGAVREALSRLGPEGFGQSVAEGSANAGPEQRSGLANMLLGAVSQGGGSQSNVLSQLGIGGNSMSSGELGSLATHVAENHPDALAGVMGNQLSGGSGGAGHEVMSLLGNPMVRHIGMQLAQKMM